MKLRPSHAWAAFGLLVGMLVMPGMAVAADRPASVQLRDDRINESSALVDLGSAYVTANDSGDISRVFLVSPKTGRTIGAVHIRTPAVDVEALAPAGPSAVWVGDIGDNDGKRKSVGVYRVTVGPGQIEVTPRRFRLVYPKGHPNAESMFVDPQGHLNIITKSIGGGVVYRAPARLSTSKPNRLQAVGRVIEYATDAALTRNGRHVIVRGPEYAGVYTVPGFQRVGGFKLPRQPQGEGIAIGPSGDIHLSSEGVHTAIREVKLPVAVLRVVDPALAPAPAPSASPAPTPSPSPSQSAGPSTSPSPSPASSSGGSSSGTGLASINPPWLMWCIPAVIAVGALGIGIGLRRRTE